MSSIRILILIGLIVNIYSLNLLPFGNFPILINRPNKDNFNQNITISFTISANSKGIQFKQYIGVQFPQISAFSLRFDLIGRFNCSLVNNQTNYVVVAEPSNHIEGYIAFCRLDDYRGLNNGNYKLTLQIIQGSLTSTQYINNLGIFLCTSAKLNRIYIDYNPNFESAYLYMDYKKGYTSPAPLDFTSVVASTTLNFGQLFDLTVNLKVNSQSFITKDSLIVFKMGNNTVYSPTFCLFNPISTTNLLQSSIYGNVGCSNFGLPQDSSVVIKGIDEDLIQSREFQIIFKNMKVKTNQPSSPDLLELFVFYKNTYTVISYANNPIFNIPSASFSTLSVNHPEGWDIYQGAAFPMQFTFAVTAEILQGAYILIQQVETDTSIRKWNFIASTCDFSGNDSSYGYTFGNRPTCVPLRYDFNYNNNLMGSGIFFKLPYIGFGFIYTVTVFGYTEICGAGPNTFMGIQNSVQFSFAITLYKSIKMTSFNENRIVYPENQIYATSKVTMQNTCWSTINGSTNNDGTPYMSNVFTDYLYSQPTDSILMSEHFDFRLGIAKTSDCSDTTSCFLTDCSVMSKFREGYMFTNNVSNLINNSYFLLKADIPIIKLGSPTPSNTSLKNNMVMPIMTIGNPPTSTINLSGKIMFKLNKNWFVDGDSSKNTCYASWGGAFNTNTNGVYTNISSPSQFMLNNIGSVNLSSNFISQGSSIDATSNGSTFLPGGNTINIMSTVDTLGFSNFKYLIDATTTCSSCNNFALSVFTTCARWASTFQITSPHNYLNFEIVYSTVKFGAGNVNRVNRFFKFITEIYAIQDPGKQFNPTLSNGFVTFHMTYFSSSNYNNAVCLVQISKNSIYLNNFDTSNMILVYLSNLILLDMDYSDLTSMYPVALSNNSINSYGLNTAPVVSSSNNVFINPLNNLFNPSMTYSSKSNYYVYASSYLIILNVAPIPQNDLLIPTYCPSKNSSGKLISYAPSASIIIGSLLNWKSFLIDRTIGSAVSSQATGTPGYTFQQFASDFPNTAIQSPNPTVALRFNAYSNQINNLLYLFYYPQNPNINTINCSGFVFLLDKSIGIDNTFSFSGQKGGYFKNTSFYAFGKVFNNAGFLATQVQTPIISITNAYPAIFSSSSSLTISGISRPNLSDLFNQVNNVNYFSPNDKLAFFCTNMNSNNIYLTNFNQNLFPPLFILDNNPDNSALTVNITKEDSETFKNDLAGKFKLTLKSTFILPQNIMIKFNLNLMRNNSFCGILNSSGFLVDCVLNQNYFECILPSSDINFTICCYNIPIFLDTLVLNSMQVVLFDPILNSSTFYTNFITYIPINSVTLNTYNSSNSVISGYVTIASLVYTQANNEGGIGKANFYLNLPRMAVRDSQIIFSGNFQQQNYLKMLNPVCNVTFNDLGNTDSLIDSCTLNLSSIPNQIIINLKKLSFKTNIQFMKSLIISIFPFFLTNYSPLSYFTTSMNLYSTGEQIVPNSPNQIINLDSNSLILAVTPVQVPVNNLFKINVIPMIANAIADYIFTIDLNAYLNQISNNLRFNEISLIFPFNLYSLIGGNLKCDINGNIVQCSETDFFLNLMMPNNFEMYYGSQLNVTISGVLNPLTVKDIFIICTLNYLIPNNTLRYNLVTGTGVIAGGINDNFIPIGNSGYLNLFKILSTNNYPRTPLQLTLKIGFETTLNATVIPASISNPIVYINVPNDFCLICCYNSIQVSIDEFTGTSPSAQPVLATLPAGKLTMVGNNIRYDLNTASKTFGTNFLFWNINIINILSPSSNTASSGLFKVIITSKDGTYVYRSLSNIYATYTNQMINPIDFYINYYRGINYSFNSNQFLIDVVCDKTNEVTIVLGTYSKCQFVLRSPTGNSKPPVSVDITLSDTRFSTKNPTYTLNSNKGNIDFQIGIKCSGFFLKVYYINFNLSDTVNYASFPPIKVNLINSNNLIISLPSLAIEVPVNGLVYFPVKLSLFNYDKIIIRFNPINPTLTSSDLSIQQMIINPMTSQAFGSFTLPKGTFSGKISFQAFIISNFCYNMDINNSIVNFNIRNTYTYPIVNEWTKYINFSFYLSRNTLPMNSLIIYVKPPFVPSYFFCAIYCSDLTMPTDDELIKVNFSRDNPDNNSVNQSIINYYKNYFQTFDEDNYQFNNLARGQNYLIKCVVNSIEQEDKAFYQSFILNPILNRDTNQLYSSISIPRKNPTSCAVYTFSIFPTNTIQMKLLNSCQRSIKIFNNSIGCLLCADNLGNLALGAKYSNNTSCSDNLIFSSNSSRLLLTNNKNFNYYVCVVQDILCPNDPVNSNLNSLKNFLKNNKNANDLQTNYGITNVPLISVSTINDKIKIDISSLNNAVISSNYLISGMYSVYIKSPLSLICYWMINNDNVNIPSFNKIMTCNTSLCGKIILIPGRITVINQTNLSNLTEFIPDIYYYIWIGCYNNIPFPNQQSNVIILTSFLIPTFIPILSNNGTVINSNSTKGNGL